MKLLEDRILSDGQVLPGEILKIDNFLNHQIDVAFVDKLGEEFYRIFHDYNITKILTVEASGISVACAAARQFGVPVVFAKKGQHKNVSSNCYTSEVYSYTKGTSYTMFASSQYLSKEDHILIIDDFLANGAASFGMMELIEKAGATLEGIGIVVEKGFQPGGKKLRDMGIKVASLAIVDSMTDTSVTFREDDV